MLPRLRKGATACVDLTSRPATCSVTSSPEQRVRPDHPLRAIRRLTDEALAALSPRFDRMYSDMGRPSIPPEQLLRALLLQSLYTIRSERLLMEEIDYSILFRWFVGLGMDEAIWSPTTFSKNRDRLLEGDIAAAFFDAVRRPGARRRPAVRRALHRRRHAAGGVGEPEELPAERRRAERRRRTIRAIRRSISTANRAATTPISRPPIPTRMLARKGTGREAKLSYAGHVLLDNRHGLVANVCVTAATGTAEREAAVLLLSEAARRGDRRRATRASTSAALSPRSVPSASRRTWRRSDGQCDRRPHDPACGLRRQSAETEADRASLRMDEDGRAACASCGTAAASESIGS